MGHFMLETLSYVVDMIQQEQLFTLSVKSSLIGLGEKLSIFLTTIPDQPKMCLED